MSRSYLFTCPQCKQKRYCTPSLEDRRQTKAEALALFRWVGEDGVCTDCMLANRSHEAAESMRKKNEEYEKRRKASAERPAS